MAYRILSLDGGGIWALIEVRALIDIYGASIRGRQVLRDFDLAAANSGGSLVLGGLLEDLRLQEILSYFQDETKRKSIFSPTHSWGDKALRELTGLGPKYSADAKLPAVERLLPTTGDTRLTDVAKGITGPSGTDVHLLIVGFDYDRNRATFFRSTQAGPGVWGDGAPSSVTLAEAIHASTNAPVNYFDAPASFPDQSARYWDGAIAGCNNPILAAVTEAVVLGQNPTDIAALSLGTGSVLLPPLPTGAPPSVFESARVDSSLVTDLRKLATSILDDPPDAATFLAHVMTGGQKGVPDPAVSRIVRMNPLISPVKDGSGNWKAPNGMTAAQFKYLCGLDMDAIENYEVNFIADYTSLWLTDQAPNQPIRLNGATLAAEIGYAWFGEARNAWRTIAPPILNPE